MNTAIRSIRFPTAYTVLFVLIALVALGTWFVPAGQYDRVENLELNREVPVPGTYKRVDQDPQGKRRFYRLLGGPSHRTDVRFTRHLGFSTDCRLTS